MSGLSPIDCARLAEVRDLPFWAPEIRQAKAHDIAEASGDACAFWRELRDLLGAEAELSGLVWPEVSR